MKTKSLFFAALVLMSAVALGAGKDEPRGTGMAVIPVKGSEIFKLVYKGHSAGKVQLNIYDASSQLVHNQTFNGVDGFIIPLNFGGLQYGEYTIVITDASGKKVEKVAYRRQDTLKNVHISRINATDKYLLSVGSNAINGPINVRIFDAGNNLIFTETKEVKGDFAQVYKLEHVSGAFTFQVSDNSGNVKTVDF
jgi:hypothetical protein